MGGVQLAFQRARSRGVGCAISLADERSA